MLIKGTISSLKCSASSVVGGGYNHLILNHIYPGHQLLPSDGSSFVVSSSLQGAIPVALSDVSNPSRGLKLFYKNYTQMKEIKKLSAPGLYQAPSCEIFSVRTEGVLCQSPYGDANAAGSTVNENPEYEYDM